MAAVGSQARLVAKVEVQSQFAKARDSMGSFHTYQTPSYKVYVLERGAYDQERVRFQRGVYDTFQEAERLS